ncbi:MAG TPA: hypothetical protein VJN44_20635, partial [Roseateles sp.]|nr:hypothetical protein [Roseateles sp.]
MTTRRSWLRSLGLPLLAWGLPRPGPAQPRVLRFTFSRAQEDPRTQWLIAVYRELLAGLGLGFEFIDVPAGRGTLMVLSGQADGELGRTYGYQDLHPSLLRLHEPNNRVEFAIYGNKPAQVFAGWEAPRRDGWRCEYRRGIPELEQLLQQQLPSDRVSAIGTIAQGLRRLQLGRTDAYLDVKEAVDDFFRFR